MDCFFAAVEMRDNPALKHIPVAIGGSRQSRGVISTCNYPARAFGVRSAMPTGQALKLCPHLTLLPGNMDKYKAASKQIQAIFMRYTDAIEPLSLDEAYLDVSDCSLFAGSATRIAGSRSQNIQLLIFSEQFIFKQIAQQLHRHVFESQGRPIGQRQHRNVVI